MDPLLEQFHRQYLQQVSNLAWPPSKLLAHSDIQNQLYRYCFDPSHDPHLPPPDYQRRVLKRLLNDIATNTDDDNDEVSDALMGHMGHLSSLPQQPTPDLAQTPRVLSYFLPTPPSPSPTSLSLDDSTAQQRRILIREAPHLLAAGANVGNRTWEACLRLGYYLCTSDERVCLRKANVLELGAGTGLLSLVCAELGAGCVVATDGLPHVLEGIRRNVELNRLAGELTGSWPRTALLDWVDPPSNEQVMGWFGGQGEGDTITGTATGKEGLDYVLGADVIYHPELHGALATVLAELKRHHPRCRVLISAPVRNEETFRYWKDTCHEHGLDVRELSGLGDGHGDGDGHLWRCPSYRQQTGLFHEQIFPIVIMEIETRGAR